VELIEEEKLRSLQIPENQTWSISIEGFLQSSARQSIVGYGNCLHEFLQQHQDHLPAFIEIGNIATRLDGKNGYENLLHDEVTGQISVNDYNVDKVYTNRQELAQGVKALFDEKTKLKSLIDDSGFEKLTLEQQSSRRRQLELLSSMPIEIFQKLNQDLALREQGFEPQSFNKEDIAKILHSQNLIQLIVGLVVAKTGWKFAWDALHDLMDRSISEEENLEILKIIKSTKGVLDCHDLRTRKMGDMILVDIHLEIDGKISVKDGHAIASEAKNLVMEKLPVLDVMTHIDPA
jgi:hypothetical protein